MCYRAGFYYQDRDYKVLRTCSYPTNVKCIAPSFAGANSSAVRRGSSPWLRGPGSSHFFFALHQQV